MTADKRVRFAGMPSIALFAATAVAVMAMVFPRQAEFSALARFGGAPDAFSIAYLEALVRSSPQDARGPVLQFARSLASVGRYDDALEWLRSLRGDPAARELQFDVEVDYLRSLKRGDARRDELVSAVHQGLTDRAAERLPPALGEHLARVALEWGWPSLAASYYRHLAQEGDPRLLEWLREAARWYLASSDPRSAAECYGKAAAHAVDVASSEDDTLAAAAALEAAGDVGEASRLVETSARRLRGSKRLLRRGVELALAAERPDAARAIGAILAAIGEASDEELRSQMNRELWARDVRAALALAEDLVRRHPRDDKLRRLEARLAEQAGNDFLALRDWTRLAR